MTCPVCQQSTAPKAADHGACIERMTAVIARLRELLQDAGITRREQGR